METTEEYDIMQQRVASRQQALRQMTDDLRWLLSQPLGSVTWTATKRDLLELVHWVWTQHSLLDDRGRPMTRSQLVGRAFTAVGLPIPTGVATIVAQIKDRLSERLSMLYRYEALAGEDHIINRFIQFNYHDTRRQDPSRTTFHVVRDDALGRSAGT